MVEVGRPDHGVADAGNAVRPHLVGHDEEYVRSTAGHMGSPRAAGCGRAQRRKAARRDGRQWCRLYVNMQPCFPIGKSILMKDARVWDARVCARHQPGRTDESTVAGALRRPERNYKCIRGGENRTGFVNRMDRRNVCSTSRRSISLRETKGLGKNATIQVVSRS